MENELKHYLEILKKESNFNMVNIMIGSDYLCKLIDTVLSYPGVSILLFSFSISKFYVFYDLSYDNEIVRMSREIVTYLSTTYDYKNANNLYLKYTQCYQKFCLIK